ncbi:MAG: GNAT family N-acetyltransferase [Nitriliruptoraceae bacterium]
MSDGPRIRRLDERLGLSVLRAGLSPVTLVTYARDHVAVRTPSRPDFRAGNTLDLTGVPEPTQLPALVERYDQTIGTLGAAHVQLRWERPLELDAPPAGPTPDTEVVAHAGALGLTVSAVTVLLLDRPVPPAGGAAVELAPVPAPDGQAGGPVDRRWHATSVLYRYLAGDTPDDWRGNDDAFVAWSVEQQRELARIGRCQVWVALRHGMPVARLTLLHDRQGLAVVEDVVVHPAHRRRGIASALAHRAIAHHLEVDPNARIGLAAAPGSGADLLARRLGFRPHATVWSAASAPAP